MKYNQISPLKYQLRTAHGLPVAEVFLQLLIAIELYDMCGHLAQARPHNV